MCFTNNIHAINTHNSRQDQSFLTGTSPYTVLRIEGMKPSPKEGP